MILSNCGIPYKAAIAKDWNYKPRTSPFLKKKKKKLDFLTFLLSQDKV